jgi:hypothetical protein
VDITGYIDRVSAHCPYLAPSLRHGLTAWTVYEIANSDPESVEAGLFHAGVQAAEWVRPLAARREARRSAEAITYMRNLAPEARSTVRTRERLSNGATTARS